MRDILILSRPEAVYYCEGEHSRPCIMISISDPFHTYDEAPFLSKENNIQALLPLSFCDAESPGLDVYGHIAEEKDLMQPEHAEQIRALLERYPDYDIIVHCDAGMSRSAGVAAAILESSGGNPARVFDSPYYDPNRLCYRVVLDALRNAERNANQRQKRREPE